MPNQPNTRDVRAFPPDTTVINYMRKQNLNSHLCLKELIDNPWDASATSIYLTITKHRICVEDNGAGCADLMSMITLGRRADHDRTQIGQYGVGLKDAAIWYADRLAITSICEGQASELTLDWRRILHSGQWLLDKPIMQLPSAEPNGTRIELSALLHKPPDKQRLMDDLGRTYMPALQAGRQIWLKYPQDTDFLAIPPFILPKLDQTRQERIEIEGKTATVTMGLIPDGMTIPGQGRGLMYIYGPRIIQQGKRLGIPPEALSEIFGWVEFTRAWTLDKNKTEFLDDLDPLEEAIEHGFADLFHAATQRRTTRPLENVERWFNERLKPLKHNGRPRKALRPGPHVKTGTVEPTGTGGKHTQADQTQPGATFIKRQFWSLRFAKLGPQGDICQLHDDVLLINEEEPSILRAMDDEARLKETIAWAAAVTLEHAAHPQLLLPWGESYDTKERIFRLFKRFTDVTSPHVFTTDEAAAD